MLRCSRRCFKSWGRTSPLSRQARAPSQSRRNSGASQAEAGRRGLSPTPLPPHRKFAVFLEKLQLNDTFASRSKVTPSPDVSAKHCCPHFQECSVFSVVPQSSPWACISQRVHRNHVENFRRTCFQKNVSKYWDIKPESSRLWKGSECSNLASVASMRSLNRLLKNRRSFGIDQLLPRSCAEAKPQEVLPEWKEKEKRTEKLNRKKEK